jgi:predicted DNA binding protein
MRYVMVRVAPAEGEAFDPLGQDLADDPEITREAMHRVELLEDGTGVLLAEARGDRERYETILAESEQVIDYSVTGSEGRWYSYTHFEPTDLTREMIERRRETEVTMEMPVRAAEDGSLEITYVGHRDAFAELSPMPADAFEMEVLETGEHHPEVGDLFAALTARQQEILDAAVRLGYYENPREATHADVAEVVDASPGTVGEHLRKVESRVFSQFVRTGERS